MARAPSQPREEEGPRDQRPLRVGVLWAAAEKLSKIKWRRRESNPGPKDFP